MHVTFVTVGASPILGLETLSAWLRKAGHQTSAVHDPSLFNDGFAIRAERLARWIDRLDDVVQDILRLKPDLLAFSCSTFSFRKASRIATEVRRHRSIPTIFGGSHPSAIPEFVLGYDAIDHVCVGEGEEALLELVEALSSGGDTTRIRNIRTKKDGKILPDPGTRPFLADLDRLPLPDKDLTIGTFPSRDHYTTMTGRGCPYRCTYCFNSFFATLPGTDPGVPRVPYLRRRSVDHVLDELVWAKRRYGYSCLEFHDDIFVIDPDWLHDFLPRLRTQVGTPFTCLAHARFLDDETLTFLRRMNCDRIKVGIQSLESREWKQRVLGRSEAEEDIARVIDTSRRIGLRIEVDHIFGFPDESAEGRRHALDFYKAHTPDRISGFWLLLLPGTEITRIAHERGIISDAQLEAIYRGEQPGCHHAQVEVPLESREEIQRLIAAFQLLPLLPPPLRQRLEPRHISRDLGMTFVARWAMASSMLLDAARGREHDAKVYLRYNLLNLRRRQPVVLSGEPP